MENKLTEQEVARVFAMYSGCEVEFVYNSPYVTWIKENRRAKLIGVRGIAAVLNPIRRNGKVDKNSENYLKVDLCKLQLSDLSDITDEDAVEVAKMNRFDKNDDPIVCAKVGRDILNRVFNTDNPHGMCIPYECADFLRERGYMIPYKGKSLFDDGWGIAIKKDKQ